MSRKIKCHRLCPVPLLDVRVTHSAKKLRRYLKSEDMGFDKEDAQHLAASFWNPNCINPLFVVYITPDLNRSWIDDAALLAHEAVHIAQGYFEHYGEKKPGEEEMAYTVQQITSSLLEQHFKWKSKRVKRTTED